jgi:hypothetical protein
MPARLEAVRTEKPGNAERLLAALAERNVPAADLFSLFRREDETLYFCTDSHWNARGAALGADAILEALGREGGWYEGGFIDGEPHRGDLYEMLYPAGAETEADLAPLTPFTFSYVRPVRAASDITIETESGASGSLVMFRDSFGNNLYPYLAQRFGHAVFSRHTAYDLSYLDRYEADTLVVELVERNLRYLLSYTPVLPAPEREAALDGAVPLPDGASCAVESSPLEGCVLLSGALPRDADDDSPLWLLADGRCWEATPRPDGFAAHLPLAADDPPALRLAYYADGQLVLCDVLPAE